MYQRILVALDGSDTSERALDSALQLAHDANAQLQPLFVVNVPLMAYDVPAYDPSYIRNAIAEEGTHVIDGAVARMRKAGVQGTPRLMEADPVADDVARCIQRAASDFRADLVVMGTHGRRGFQRLMLGSVAEHFLRVAECAVLMISAHCALPATGVPRVANEAVKELS
ncbi:nucleotide-binding universal stress UspA family protein [Paraburkholderia sp. BL27I4N3]|uniref:universal stress protein n=1 Tax=Paraburkholderia sp. BL27I4N3 TaxID=1938805 RepID=UPI000E23794D|nr:universal stress protein [Paraburkholderia sp. BL27I4N3]REE21441.1 nucleotide-binding universal stress UspA family protein [Paraburkholderia sp. BL27I4N3]